MSLIEAVYIFNEHNNAIVTHTFTARPPPATTLLPLYLAQPEPRPSCLYLPTTNPATLLFSMVQDNLLFVSPCSTDTEPLLVLEFLHRVADALEEFLGAPLLTTKLEYNYDVVAQVLGEMCDGGLVGGTEANALRDVVDTPNWMGRLLGGVGLPGTSPALNSSSTPFPGLGGGGGSSSMAPTLSTSGSQIPWRRSNVRHTSNEMYVDIVESLSVTYAPSGRPLAAFANGSIAFTSKVSGVPDLLLTLRTGSGGGGSGSGGGGGGDKVRRTMERPVFHPCVRLARWREHAELSFVPPDGRFVLAGYDVDLLDPSASPLSAKANDLNLPASVEVRTGLGATGADFEVRLNISKKFYTGGSTSGGGGGGGGGGVGLGLGSATSSLSSNLGRPAALRAASNDPKTPLLEDLTVTVPMPAGVRNINDLRATKGEANYNPGDAAITWRLGAKEAATISGAGAGAAVLRCTVVGATDENDEATIGGSSGSRSNGIKASTYDYDDDDDDDDDDEKEDTGGAYRSGTSTTKPRHENEDQGAREARRSRQNAVLMPGSASLSFSIKGWLASGLKVDGLTIDTKRSKGLGEGVRPYKGVKYLTVSREGIEVRC